MQLTLELASLLLRVRSGGEGDAGIICIFCSVEAAEFRISGGRSVQVQASVSSGDSLLELGRLL